LEDKFGLTVVIDNDMNCGVLGEYRHGAGKNIDRLMVMTVGTGIGMSVALGGRVLRFNARTVGNPGHVIVSGDGPVCAAGCRGCVESLAAAGPISRLAEDLARSNRETLLRDSLAKRGSLSPVDLFHAAEAGDGPSQAIWNEVGTYLGRGLASWVAIFGPEVVVVGGGIALAGHWLLDPIERELRRVGEPHFVGQVREVRLSALGKDSAMHGAATLVLWPEDAPPH
jgi:glucokinase